MKHINVVMYLPSLEARPKYPMPAGYVGRRFRRGEERIWADIEASVGEFENADTALRHFEDEFGGHLAEMEDRCYFLCTEAGEPVGTGTAWLDPSFRGEDHGRVHWIAIIPQFQGRGLGRPLVGLVVDRLAQSHRKAYLTTQTTSPRAIRIYLDFGFIPILTDERSGEAWQLLHAELRHPALLAPRRLEEL
ncbi:MAG: GNAT family N-acetyltransferase [Armatimonadota bacterium]|jgi:ribosomal protein S18 acetylase RimI-like enzyme